MPADREVRDEVVKTCLELHQRGWVANHDGNITVRLGQGRFLATPTATSKARVSGRDLIEVDGAGKRVAGTKKPFGELALHLAIYGARDDVGAVVHAHPPHATAIAASGQNLIERPFIAEAVVSIGDFIPLLSLAPTGEGAAAAVATCAGEVDAALLESHGVFAWGKDVEQAYLRLELVEHLARIALLAAPIGGVKPLPEEMVRALLKKRAKAGLGKAADRAGERGAGERKRVFACAPAPHADVEVTPPPRSSTGESQPRKAVVAAIREEVMRVLREGK